MPSVHFENGLDVATTLAESSPHLDTEGLARSKDRARTYLIRHTTRDSKAKLAAIDHRFVVPGN